MELLSAGIPFQTGSSSIGHMEESAVTGGQRSRRNMQQEASETRRTCGASGARGASGTSAKVTASGKLLITEG